MGLERCLIIRGKTKTTIIMCEIKIFKNAEFGKVRVNTVNNEPMFCLSDVCRVLDIKNPSDAKTRLRKEGVVTAEVSTPIVSQGVDTGKNKTMSMTFINEPNLYKLIFQSRKEEAERFQDWVTSEVLPSIRKNGGYISNQSQLTPEQIMANALVVAQKIIEEQNNQMLQMTQKMSVLEKKSDYLDIILQSKKTVTISQIAQDYGFSAKAFNKILKELHIQHKINGQWILYASYLGEGYVHSKTVSITRSDGTPDTVMNTEWTQKGRIFLYNTLKGNGYLPLIEQ